MGPLPGFNAVPHCHYLAFVHDIESVLKALSLAFQGLDLTPSSLEQGLTRAYDDLETMKTVDGRSLLEKVRRGHGGV